MDAVTILNYTYDNRDHYNRSFKHIDSSSEFGQQRLLILTASFLNFGFTNLI
jgi:hypothetical protein